MNIINGKLNWQYRYIDCSINKKGVPKIESKNKWRSTKTLKIVQVNQSKN